MIITTKEVLRDRMQGGLFMRSFSALNLAFNCKDTYVRRFY